MISRSLVTSLKRFALSRSAGSPLSIALSNINDARRSQTSKPGNDQQDNNRATWIMERAKINEHLETVDVKFENNEQPLSYPFVWLRDCCQCDECFHPDSKARMLLLEDLQLDSKPRTVDVSKRRFWCQTDMFKSKF